MHWAILVFYQKSFALENSQHYGIRYLIFNREILTCRKEFGGSEDCGWYSTFHLPFFYLFAVPFKL